MAIYTPARITADEGPALAVTAIDLSMGGVKLSCDKDVVLSMLSDKQGFPGSIPGIEAVLELPLPNAQVEQNLKSRCRVVNFYRRAENLFEIGCQFVDIVEDQQSLINSYIEQVS